jgi:anti-anti-sigma regulatory factor
VDIDSEVIAMGKVSAPTAVSSGDMLSLPSSCTVRESAALKVELLTLFDSDANVTLDIRAVERVDTAVLQLLLSFVRDRAQVGRVTNWVGLPECINEAVAVLGLNTLMGIVASDSTEMVA